MNLKSQFYLYLKTEEVANLLKINNNNSYDNFSGLNYIPLFIIF